MSAFGYTRYGQAFGVAVNDAGARVSDKLLTATDRLAAALFELGSCSGLENNYTFLYPFVGGTQVAHSVNLADPSRNRIFFDDDTTVTHNANGITGPGNVQLFPFDDPSTAGCYTCFGLYCRSGVKADQPDMMCQATNTHGIACGRATYGDMVFWNGLNNSTAYIAVANSNPQGFYTSMRRTSDSTHYAYKNGVNVGGIVTGSAGNTGTFYLFGGNSHNLAFCFLSKRDSISGVPLTGAMQTSLYAIVQKFQQWAGRAV